MNGRGAAHPSAPGECARIELVVRHPSPPNVEMEAGSHPTVAALSNSLKLSEVCLTIINKALEWPKILLQFVGIYSRKLCRLGRALGWHCVCLGRFGLTNAEPCGCRILFLNA